MSEVSAAYTAKSIAWVEQAGRMPCSLKTLRSSKAVREPFERVIRPLIAAAEGESRDSTFSRAVV